MSVMLNALRAKWYPPRIPTTSFATKTIIITGSNTGLGFYAAQHFIALSASNVILAVRDPAKGAVAKQKLDMEASGSHTKVTVMPLDMNRYASVLEFAERVTVEYENIDVVVLNAGIINRKYRRSPEGWEETLQVNTLSTILLSLLLLPKLQASKKSALALPHLVLVSSEAHEWVQRSSLFLNALNIFEASSFSASTFHGRTQYGISKLFLMYGLKALTELATSPDGEPQVLVTACCPGFCFSDLGREFNRWYERIVEWAIYSLLARSREEGSRTLVSAATLGAQSHGAYWKNDILKRQGDLVTSPEGKELQKQVWQEITNALKSNESVAASLKPVIPT